MRSGTTGICKAVGAEVDDSKFAGAELRDLSRYEIQHCEAIAAISEDLFEDFGTFDMRRRALGLLHRNLLTIAPF